MADFCPCCYVLHVRVLGTCADSRAVYAMLRTLCAPTALTPRSLNGVVLRWALRRALGAGRNGMAATRSAVLPVEPTCAASPWRLTGSEVACGYAALPAEADVEGCEAESAEAGVQGGYGGESLLGVSCDGVSSEDSGVLIRSLDGRSVWVLQEVYTAGGAAKQANAGSGGVKAKTPAAPKGADWI